MNRSPIICPVCAEPLCLEERTYRCENNHSFDLAKEGYINLLLSHQRKSKNPGDDKAMVQARRRFFDSGAFDQLIKAIQHSTTCPPKPLAKDGSHILHSTILDCGCGEGHFLGALSENGSTTLRLGSAGGIALPLPQLLATFVGRERSKTFAPRLEGLCPFQPYNFQIHPYGEEITKLPTIQAPLHSERIGKASLSERAGQLFGIDISKEAIRLAAKRYKGATWIVANGMRELPLADRSMDCILSVLAPRNHEEFARILKPDGKLILGVPGPNHLIELRTLLNASAGDFEEKADEAVEKCAPLFSETNRENVSYEIALNQQQISDLIQMTPIFWNSSPEAKEEVQHLDRLDITVSFVLLTLEP